MTTIVNILLTLRSFQMGTNDGINMNKNYSPPRGCFRFKNDYPLAPKLVLDRKYQEVFFTNKPAMCTVKCPMFRNVTLKYKIQPRDGAADVSYNVLCRGCNSSFGGIKDQFQTQVVFCQGGLVDNKLYEIEVATEDGHKGYSTIAVMTEIMESFSGSIEVPAGPGYIRFDKISSNMMLSYNETQGLFKPKREAYYTFYMTARTKTDRYTKMELRKNGVAVASITNDVLVEHGWEFEDGATAIVLKLKLGDEISVYSNGTLQSGSSLSCFSLRTLMDGPPAILYATVQDNKVLPYSSYQPLSYDHVHLDTAGAFVGKTNYTIPSDGIYVVTLTSATHNDPVHASFINLKFKILRYTTVKTPARSTNSYTFIMRFNESEVISNTFYAENETHLSSETSIAVFKYFSIDEPDVTAVTVQQNQTRKDCTDFCNLLVQGKVFLDIDSSFDATTGIFTAKRSDTYVISANLLGMQVDTTYQIVVNGDVVDMLLSDGPDNDYFINDSKVVMVKRLWQGDKVEFRMKGRSFFHTLISIWTLTA
ncbi:uncharacterized protein [Magallana gigas]|uniref:uncharacterized protein n=1 Tax=Magallana gigas TaxID=29159 RepID=UPI0033412703